MGIRQRPTRDVRPTWAHPNRGHAPRRPIRPRPGAALAAAAVTALVLAACGGAAEPETTATSPSPTAVGSPSPSPSPATSPTPSTSPAATEDPLDGLAFDVDQSFWHSGFAVTLGGGLVEARLGADDQVEGHDLRLAGAFENVADDEGTFRPDLEIVQDGTTFVAAGDTEWPTVGGGLTTESELVFEVDETFDPATAMLVVGSADQARAEIPLTADAGTLVDLPPEQVDVTGTMSLDLLDITITGAELRWDIPALHDEVPAGERALTLVFTATSRKSGNWGINAHDFALTLPDGASVPADDAQLASLPGNDSGLDTADLWLRFLVPEATGGDYTLRITPGDWWLDSGPTEASLDFTLP